MNSNPLAKKIAGLCAALLFCLNFAHVFAVSNDDVTIYFNSATEKYLQGNFEGSITDLDKAREIDASNEKLKGFEVKVLIEVITQNHLMRNYKKAFEYIKKAQTIAPDNAKVVELYNITQGLLNAASQNKSLYQGQSQPALVKSAEIAPPVNKSQPKPAVVVKPKDSSNNYAQYDMRAEAAKYAMFANELDKKPVSNERIAMLILAAVVFILIAILLVLLARLFKHNRTIEEKDKQIKDIEIKLNGLLIEHEKAKEQIKYEKQIQEQYKLDLKEIKRAESDRVKKELESKSDTVLVPNFPQAQGLISQDQKRFKAYLDTTANEPGEQSAEIEAARTRIAVMAENLFDYAPIQAIEFLEKMANSKNAMIRVNVIHALGHLATTDTLELMVKMYSDNESDVKREVLKNMKRVIRRVNQNTLVVDPLILQQMVSIIDEEKKKGEWII